MSDAVGVHEYARLASVHAIGVSAAALGLPRNTPGWLDDAARVTNALAPCPIWHWAVTIRKVNQSSDQDLLREYAQGDSDAAFSELTRRYVDLVYSAALR